MLAHKPTLRTLHAINAHRLISALLAMTHKLSSLLYLPTTPLPSVQTRTSRPALLARNGGLTRSQSLISTSLWLQTSLVLISASLEKTFQRTTSRSWLGS